jgi:hypothetical protein
MLKADNSPRLWARHGTSHEIQYILIPLGLVLPDDKPGHVGFEIPHHVFQGIIFPAADDKVNVVRHNDENIQCRVSIVAPMQETRTHLPWRAVPGFVRSERRIDAYRPRHQSLRVRGSIKRPVSRMATWISLPRVRPRA